MAEPWLLQGERINGKVLEGFTHVQIHVVMDCVTPSLQGPAWFAHRDDEENQGRI